MIKSEVTIDDKEYRMLLLVYTCPIQSLVHMEFKQRVGAHIYIISLLHSER
jgi:hypothetical protein